MMITLQAIQERNLCLQGIYDDTIYKGFQESI